MTGEPSLQILFKAADECDGIILGQRRQVSALGQCRRELDVGEIELEADEAGTDPVPAPA
jgi:hypothetical protein